jgi:hypothetical protein
MCINKTDNMSISVGDIFITDINLECPANEPSAILQVISIDNKHITFRTITEWKLEIVEKKIIIVNSETHVPFNYDNFYLGAELYIGVCDFYGNDKLLSDEILTDKLLTFEG